MLRNLRQCCAVNPFIGPHLIWANTRMRKEGEPDGSKSKERLKVLLSTYADIYHVLDPLLTLHLPFAKFPSLILLFTTSPLFYAKTTDEDFPVNAHFGLRKNETDFFHHLVHRLASFWINFHIFVHLGDKMGGSDSTISPMACFHPSSQCYIQSPVRCEPNSAMIMPEWPESGSTSHIAMAPRTMKTWRNIHEANSV